MKHSYRAVSTAKKRSNIVLYVSISFCLLSCQKYTLEKRDSVFVSKRDRIVNDTAVKVKPTFISLPAGSVRPQGWIKDWAEDAVNGITGHLDEWSVTYGMAWKGIGFEARGVDTLTGTGWPLEQASYWLDGAVRLAYILEDSALIKKTSDRLNMVVDGVLNGGKSFIYWHDMDFKDAAARGSFNSWSHSHMGRALVAYYEATGDSQILDALTKVYADFAIASLPFQTRKVSGCTNIDPMLAAYELSGDKKILKAVLNIAGNKETKETVHKWTRNDFDNGHGVIVYENLRIPAMMYPLINDTEYLNATRQHLQWLEEKHVLPFGIASSEEYVAGIGSTRNTETCNTAASAWTYQQLYEITGEGELGDRIEKIFFNAAPAPVARDYQSMAYYQSPNRIEGLIPAETPGHPTIESSYIFRPTGHEVLCCVGNLTRTIPNYIMHMWMGTTDKGIAATLYGPSVVNSIIGKNIPVKLTCKTDYPFEEDIRITVEPATACTFPLYLRIPEWCSHPVVEVNETPFDVNTRSGFVQIKRKWKRGDIIRLKLPMRVVVNTARETPFPRVDYFLKGNSSGRPLALQTEVSNPFRTVFYGPLLFALAVKDITPNRQMPGEKWNYALVSETPETIEVRRNAMPDKWSWQIDEAPVKLRAKAKVFDWQPTAISPLPDEMITGTEDAEITLVPYGCTKFRISMFPIKESNF